MKLGTKFASWEELEAEFLQTWCVVMSSTMAIVEVAKVHQWELINSVFIWPSLRNTVLFFKDTLKEEAIISLILKCPEGFISSFYFCQKSKAIVGHFPE